MRITYVLERGEGKSVSSFSCGNSCITRIFRLFENLYCQRTGNIFVSAFEEGIDLKSPFFVNF